MIAANIWHWWIGVVLTGAGLLAVLGVGAGYLRTVTAKRLPPEHRPAPGGEQSGESAR